MSVTYWKYIFINWTHPVAALALLPSPWWTQWRATRGDPPSLVRRRTSRHRTGPPPTPYRPAASLWHPGRSPGRTGPTSGAEGVSCWCDRNTWATPRPTRDLCRRQRVVCSPGPGATPSWVPNPARTERRVSGSLGRTWPTSAERTTGERDTGFGAFDGAQTRLYRLGVVSPHLQTYWRLRLQERKKNSRSANCP